MKEQPAAAKRPPSRDRIRVGLNRLRVSQRHGIFGVAEIVGLFCSVVILVVVLASYLYFLVPARSRLASLQLERSLLQNKLRTQTDLVRKGKSTEAIVHEITQSLDTFENKQLVGHSRGRMELYGALNDLIRKNGLRNTSGPTYTAIDPTESKPGAVTTKSTRTKWQSVYPGIAISLTVEGQYQSLRRFVHDIEASKQFIIVNDVELERATQTDTTVSAPDASAPGSRASLVSLRLDMATYFQRDSTENSAAMEIPEH